MWDVVCLGDVFVDRVPHSKADGQWLSPGIEHKRLTR
jgi:hypothetical protein